MAMEPWMLEVNGAGLAKVAEALALHVEGQILCAGCGHAVRPTFAHWRCDHCQARGDALTYAALALEARPARWAALRDLLAERGLCQRAA